MIKKTIILLVLYFFAVLPYQFVGKRIFWQTNIQEPEPGVFGSLEPEPEPLEKNQEPGPLWEKISSQSRSRRRLKKKSKAGARAGAAKKFAGSPALLYDYGIVTYLIPILGTFINILIGRHLASGEAGRERKRRKLGEKILKGRKIEMWAKKREMGS